MKKAILVGRNNVLLGGGERRQFLEGKNVCSSLEGEKESISWRGRIFSSSRGLGKTMQLVRVRKKAVLSGEK